LLLIAEFSQKLPPPHVLLVYLHARITCQPTGRCLVTWYDTGTHLLLLLHAVPCKL
jgi:hypothetical protein